MSSQRLPLSMLVMLLLLPLLCGAVSSHGYSVGDPASTTAPKRTARLARCLAQDASTDDSSTAQERKFHTTPDEQPIWDMRSTNEDLQKRVQAASNSATDQWRHDASALSLKGLSIPDLGPSSIPMIWHMQKSSADIDKLVSAASTDSTNGAPTLP